jgi:acetyl-CoA acetyltransferase
MTGAPPAPGADPLSQFRQRFSVEEVLAAAPITFPLRLPMCAPLSDGAAAAVLCSGAVLRRMAGDRSRAIRIAASIVRSFTHRAIDDPRHSISRLAADSAYEQAVAIHIRTR